MCVARRWPVPTRDRATAFRLRRISARVRASMRPSPALPRTMRTRWRTTIASWSPATDRAHSSAAREIAGARSVCPWSRHNIDSRLGAERFSQVSPSRRPPEQLKHGARLYVTEIDLFEAIRPLINRKQACHRLARGLLRFYCRGVSQAPAPAGLLGDGELLRQVSVSGPRVSRRIGNVSSTRSVLKLATATALNAGTLVTVAETRPVPMLARLQSKRFREVSNGVMSRSSMASASSSGDEANAALNC